MITKEKILRIAREKGKVTTTELSAVFPVSRQYLNRLINELVLKRQLLKIGGTRYAFYVPPEYLKNHPEILPLKYTKTWPNVGLEEHLVLASIKQKLPEFSKIPENVQSIFTYAFSEMLNNAIEHSKSKNIHLEVSIEDKLATFLIEDNGIGVWQNVMKKRKLKSELEAIQDILKGRTTTMPKAHSGEGIFFTSKVGDLFILDSYAYELTINNEIPDVFVERIKRIKKGTRVTFNIKTNSTLHLNDVFMKYTNLTPDSHYGFDKTEITVKLYTIGDIHISRSQARRVLSGLDKFKIILLDFDQVPIVGQAFADEIFRVFHQKYPEIKLEAINMTEGVAFMIDRTRNMN